MSLSNKEQTLFLRDSTLFLLKDGVEYQVSNPEVVGRIASVDNNFFVLKYPLKTVSNNGLLSPDDRVEWPGGVELIKKCKRELCQMTGSCPAEFEGTICKGKDVARLLPKEEKKEDSDPGVNHYYNTAHSFTEGDYQQVDISEAQEKRKYIESSEPQGKEKIIIEGKTEWTPIESQEELWEEVLKYCDEHFINDIRVKEYLSKRFSLTRLNPHNK